ncbi:MAG: carbohydrate ABC transporter permease [Spirochaetaceae bacterium]
MRSLSASLFGRRSLYNRGAVKNFIFAAILVLWSVVPILWVVISSISPRTELYSVPPNWIPENPTLQPYRTVLIQGEGFRGGETQGAARLIRTGLLNSLIISLSTTALVMLVAPLLGYTFGRLRFPGRRFFFFFVLALIALPGWPIIIGLFPMMADLQLLDTKFGLVLLLFTYRIPFEVWFMTGYFRMVPSEIEDAARVDGCTRLQALYKIVIFMVQPGIIAVSIISFLHSWNFFLLPLIMSYTLKSKPLTVTITEFIGQYFVHWDLMSAATIIAIIPPLIMVMLFQRYIVKGLSAGAIK